jgi:hypothetical protein
VIGSCYVIHQLFFIYSILLMRYFLEQLVLVPRGTMLQAGRSRV